MSIRSSPLPVYFVWARTTDYPIRVTSDLITFQSLECVCKHRQVSCVRLRIWPASKSYGPFPVFVADCGHFAHDGQNIGRAVILVISFCLETVGKYLTTALLTLSCASEPCSKSILHPSVYMLVMMYKSVFVYEQLSRGKLGVLDYVLLVMTSESCESLGSRKFSLGCYITV